MKVRNDPVGFDARLLFEATKRLHGYLLHVWFEKYLDLIFANARRWVEYGLLGPDGRPTRRGNYAVAFDYDAIDMEKVAYALGFYFYILASHKKANWFLMNEAGAKRVLYLRGFDYEGATYTGGGMAMGYQSIDTFAFNGKLVESLGPEFQIFSALSPGDLHWYTVSAQRYFYGDYDGLIQSCSEPIRFLYLNASRWRADVNWLLDRMDYFVVYVSSITESVLWELALLKRRGRAGDVTVVFDERAIGNKEVQAGWQQRMREMSPNEVLWEKGRAGEPAPDAKGLRESLARNFLVVSPDEFSRRAARHRKRIRESRGGPAAAEARAEPLPFRFYPAQGAATLKKLRELDASTGALIRRQVSSRRITNLPWFLNNVQLRILTSLMLGEHGEAGRALAAYAAVMDVARERLYGERASADAAGEGQETPAARVLRQHFEMGDYASPRLMACGQSHEFGDYSAGALKAYDRIFASTSAAVGRFFDEVRRRRGIKGGAPP